MWILTSAEMRLADQATIEGAGVPGVCLMELAGVGAVRVLLELGRPAPGEPVAILCGGGNNGGDGYVMARHLAARGWQPQVFLLTPAAKIAGDARINLEALGRLGLPVHDASTPAALEQAAAAVAVCRVRVDALLGTGLSSEVRGMPAAGIALLERTRQVGRTFTLAVDLPSGLSADTGQPLGQAVHAEATATFGALKRGHLLHPGPAYCGTVQLVDLGIAPAAIEALAPGLWGLDEEEVRRLLPPRPADCHKGNFGRILVVAGSPGMAGAGLLAAHGAVRAGGGVVTLATVAEGCAAARARFPSLLTRLRGPELPLEPRELAARHTAAVLGPGLGLEPEAAALVERWVGQWPHPLVVDADALTLLARSGPPAAWPSPRLLTPHEGELSRLIGWSVAEIHASRVDAVREAARRWAAVVVLKGPGTLVAEATGRVTLIRRGHPVLATGGSGDVLAGTIAALLGQGLTPRQAAEAGCYLHGLAGELAAAAIGPAGVTAEELADQLPRARGTFGVRSSEFGVGFEVSDVESR